MTTGGGAERTSAMRVLARTTVAWSDYMKRTRKKYRSRPMRDAGKVIFMGVVRLRCWGSGCS